jgi:glycosyltransferase involved in cell wall biosynthesis
MRILFVQPSLQPPGGGNGVAAWMIRALRREHQLTVLTWAAVDLEAVNRHFGTDLVLSDARFERAFPRAASLLDRLPTPTDLLKTSLLMRTARARATEFDLAISGNNEADFGPRAIQYIHYPRYQRPRPVVDVRWFHAKAVLSAYYACADAIAGISFERMRANRTLVNSDWTRDLVKRLHGIDARTVHPPIRASERALPWSERKPAFLMIGRLSPEKEIEKGIAIMDSVRQRGHDVGLTIAGAEGPPDYRRKIASLVGERAAWARLEIDVSRDALDDLLGSHRYGLHAMSEEHFGMAAAEMAASGCLVFMPAGGGQSEIVDRDPRLLYSSVEDASKKIVTFLDSTDLQTTLRSVVAKRALEFRVETFEETIRSAAREFSPDAPQ